MATSSSTSSSRTTPLRFDKQFWFLSLALAIIWAIVFTSAAPASSDEQEQKNARHCKALCEHCGGLGFYCGEECICEVNDDSSDTECIATMQSNARKLNIPFEMLIQGPSNNRFVRNALQFEQNIERKSVIPRNKRSTVVIYKPTTTLQNSLYGTCEKKSAAEGGEAKKSIRKRSVDQLEWLSDLKNTLVRPAPLRPIRKENQAAATAEDTMQHKRSTPKLDRSWFTDNSNFLLKPAPLFKRQSEDSESSNEGPMEKLPQVLKDTISSIKGTAINDDFGEALRLKIREGAEAFQSQLRDANFNIFSDPMRETWQEAWKSQLSNKVWAPTMETPTAAPPVEFPKVNLPWLRPMRFLQRVQQAIN